MTVQDLTPERLCSYLLRGNITIYFVCLLTGITNIGYETQVCVKHMSANDWE